MLQHARKGGLWGRLTALLRAVFVHMRLKHTCFLWCILLRHCNSHVNASAKPLGRMDDVRCNNNNSASSRDAPLNA